MRGPWLGRLSEPMGGTNSKAAVVAPAFSCTADSSSFHIRFETWAPFSSSALLGYKAAPEGKGQGSAGCRVLPSPSPSRTCCLWCSYCVAAYEGIEGNIPSCQGKPTAASPEWLGSLYWDKRAYSRFNPRAWCFSLLPVPHSPSLFYSNISLPSFSFLLR